MEITPGQARYELVSGEPLDIIHDGSPVTLVASEPQTLAWTAPPDLPPVTPPTGREPMRRGIGADDGRA